jgi:hypothetical protein
VIAYVGEFGEQWGCCLDRSFHLPKLWLTLEGLLVVREGKEGVCGALVRAARRLVEDARLVK